MKKIKKDNQSYGQSGKRIAIAPKELNHKEKRVWLFLSDKKKSCTLDEIAELFKRQAKREKAQSWVRNSLRRLVRGGFVTRGAVSDDGRVRYRVGVPFALRSTAAKLREKRAA